MTVLAVLALAIWIYLLCGRGMFWLSGPVLAPMDASAAPTVTVVVPARNEAAVIDRALRSLLAQDYRGPFRVILVDDNSTDGTATIAGGLADPRLGVLTGGPKPPDWSGKLWAVAQGVSAARDSELILLTDADIEHKPSHLRVLVAQMERHDLDLVSEMVELACESWAERTLVPAFVFFFQLLYPFAWVNDAKSSTAAAAGGTILVRQRAIARIGGIGSIRGALIDDVALASEVKKAGRIWLGHSDLARSIRPYPDVADIWRMIARTAFVQLRRSWLLLCATIIGMGLTWIVPPVATLVGHGWVSGVGLAAWGMLSLSYLPTLRRYRRSGLWAPLLPLIAVFYMAATIASAVNDARGRGVAWKGRAYQGTVA